MTVFIVMNAVGRFAVAVDAAAIPAVKDATAPTLTQVIANN